jgi:hypothetical protein
MMESDMKIYSVTVKYQTVSPMYHQDTFQFSDESEAVAFCDKCIENGWIANYPQIIINEVFTCDSAMGWVIDEIEACKQAVLSNPSSYLSKSRAEARK